MTHRSFQRQRAQPKPKNDESAASFCDGRMQHCYLFRFFNAGRRHVMRNDHFNEQHCFRAQQ